MRNWTEEDIPRIGIWNSGRARALQIQDLEPHTQNYIPFCGIKSYFNALFYKC